MTPVFGNRLGPTVGVGMTIVMALVDVGVFVTCGVVVTPRVGDGVAPNDARVACTNAVTSVRLYTYNAYPTVATVAMSKMRMTPCFMPVTFLSYPSTIDYSSKNRNVKLTKNAVLRRAHPDYIFC